MANPHPTPRLENLRPPWQPGTSGNPAGYSQGRRISDAMEGLIDELGLQREFGTAAIAMALGKKHLLKQKVTDLSRSWASSSPTSLQAIWLPARSWPGKLAPTLGPWWPGRRFRCFIRCLHRKGPRMASRPQRRKPENRNPERIGLLKLLRPPSKVHAQAPSVTPEPALVNHAEKSANSSAVVVPSRPPGVDHGKNAWNHIKHIDLVH